MLLTLSFGSASSTYPCEWCEKSRDDFKMLESEQFHKIRDMETCKSRAKAYNQDMEPIRKKYKSDNHREYSTKDNDTRRSLAKKYYNCINNQIIELSPDLWVLNWYHMLNKFGTFPIMIAFEIVDYMDMIYHENIYTTLTA